MTARFIIGDTRDVVASLPAGSVDLVLTSPPFLALRSYLPADHPDKGREIGSEPTPAAFLDTLLELTALWGRALAPHGSIAVELGDTYSGSGGAGGDYADDGLRAGQAKFSGSASRDRICPKCEGYAEEFDRAGNRYDCTRCEGDGFVNAARDRNRRERDRLRDTRPGRAGTASASTPRPEAPGGRGWPLAKSLALVPELYRIALAYGINPLTGQPSPAGRWIVRNVVRWVRPNPPVGALGDKFRPATSDLVIATRDPKRWFDLDAVRTEAQQQGPRNTNGNKGGRVHAGDEGAVKQYQVRIDSNPAGAPPLDWWEIVPKGYEGAHYATWPPELCVKPIEAMCPRRVCRTCGAPSRRETSEPTELRQRHADFSAALRAARQAAGMTQRAVDEHFGHNGMCSHWERAINSDRAQPAYPTPDQWDELCRLLGMDSETFGPLVRGARRWAERDLDPEYRAAIEQTRAAGFYADKGTDGMARSGVNGRSTVAAVNTTGWSSCGCPGTDGIRLDGFHTGTGWRPGIVLDPFAGTFTTGAVATGHGRDCIGIDLDERNAELARQRLGMFLDVECSAA